LSSLVLGKALSIPNEYERFSSTNMIPPELSYSPHKLVALNIVTKFLSPKN